MKFSSLEKKVDNLESTSGTSCPGCQDWGGWLRNTTEEELRQYEKDLIELDNPDPPWRYGQIMRTAPFCYEYQHSESCTFRRRLEAMSNEELEETISSLIEKCAAGDSR